MAEGVDGDLEELGGAGLVAGAAAEGLFDEILFELAKVGRQVKPLGRKMMAGGAVRRDLFDAIGGRDRFAGAGEGDSPLDRVFELADVAMPGSIYQQIHGFIGDRDRFAGAGRESIDEINGKLG